MISRSDLAAAARQPWVIAWRRVLEVMTAIEALQHCRVCGCTDDDACAFDPIGDDAGTVPCWWVAPGLCSGCA